MHAHPASKGGEANCCVDEVAEKNAGGWQIAIQHCQNGFLIEAGTKCGIGLGAGLYRFAEIAG